MVFVEHKIDIPMLDWIRAMRRIGLAEDGKSIPKAERLYLKGRFIVQVLPLEVELYVDEKNLVFVKESDVVKWEHFERFKDSFVSADKIDDEDVKIDLIDATKLMEFYRKAREMKKRGEKEW